MKIRLLVVAAAIAVCLSVVRAAEEWPQFRGVMAGVGVDHPDLPDTWSPTTNVSWVATVPGLGWSSPVVWGDHVFLTSVVNTRAAGAAQARVLSGRLARVHGAAPLDGL